MLIKLYELICHLLRLDPSKDLPDFLDFTETFLFLTLTARD